MRAGAWYQCGFLPDGRAGSDAGDARLVPCPAPVASARDAFDGGWGFAVARVDADDATGGRLYAWGECARDHVLEEPPTTSSRARDHVLPARLVDAAADAREDPGPVAAGWAHVVFLVHGAGGDTVATPRAPSDGAGRRARPRPRPRATYTSRAASAPSPPANDTPWPSAKTAPRGRGATTRAANSARRGRRRATGTTRRDDPAAEPPATAAAAEPPATITFASRVALPPGVHVVAACAGARHSVVVDARGAAYAFGWGLHGQLGLGDGEDARAPTRVASLDGIFIARAAAGTAHTVLLTHHGTAYAFGSNHHGQLGVPEETCPPGSATAEPVMVEIRGDPNDEVEFADVRSRRARREGVATPPDVFDGVSCGSRHTAAVSKDGTIRAWGWNARGQLGTGDRIDRSTPTAVEIPGGRRAARVACGWWHTLVEVVDEDEG